ncbi:MAG: SH3 domain-containing protein [Calothrix sp. C42_A2020_038]|nr:SH3 domain-containing protein [Calothrix sp. C42_A2020_038]
MSNWKRIFSFVTLFIFSVAGVQTSAASVKQNRKPPQKCDQGKSPYDYVRVTTKQGSQLNVRNSPNGRIIGQIPNNWAIVPVRKDSTGKWTRIQFASYAGYAFDVNEYGFASAPRFRTGWVASEFLKPLGKFCEKPVAMLRMQINALFGNQSIVVNEDWVQRGDRISRAIFVQEN